MNAFLFRYWSRGGVVLAVFAGVLSGTMALGTTVMPIEVTCPVCGQKIAALSIVSTNTFGGQDTDLLTRAVGTQPILIVPIVCTNCYYAGYQKDFDKNVQLSDEIKQKLRKTLKPPVPIKNTGDSEDVPAWARYDLMAQTYTTTGKSSEVVAFTYHCASWAVRLSSDVLGTFPEARREKIFSLLEKKKLEPAGGLENNLAASTVEMGRQLSRQLPTAPQQERMLMGLAAIAFLREHGENPLAAETLLAIKDVMPAEDFQKLQKSLSESIALEQNYQKKTLELLEKLAVHEKTSDEERPIYLYLCGELHRRLGQAKEARLWFEKAQQQKGPDWILELTAQQMKLLGPEKAQPPEKEKK